jgi:hypothetical protein
MILPPLVFPVITQTKQGMGSMFSTGLWASVILAGKARFKNVNNCLNTNIYPY